MPFREVGGNRGAGSHHLVGEALERDLHPAGNCESDARGLEGSGEGVELHAAGHTIVVVSHQPGDITSFCNRAILLEGGRVVREGTGAEVAESYLGLLAGDNADQRLATASAFAT